MLDDSSHGVRTAMSDSRNADMAAQDLARKLGVDHLEFRNVAPRHAEWPTQDLYVTFRKAILPKEEDNMLAIPRKQRAMVRKGIKNGLKSEIDPGVDRFFQLYADNVHRHGTPPYSRRFAISTSIGIRMPRLSPFASGLPCGTA